MVARPARAVYPAMAGAVDEEEAKTMSVDVEIEVAGVSDGLMMLLVAAVAVAGVVLVLELCAEALLLLGIGKLAPWSGYTIPL